MTELDRHFLPPSSAHALSEPLADAHCDVRPDVASKLTGNPGFLTDRVAAGQLRGVILGSPYPHARILHIDTRKARLLPGVIAVVTHADIRGVANYGLRKVDRPVLCHDKVRCVGDPVAAVAAVDLAPRWP